MTSTPERLDLVIVAYITIVCYPIVFWLVDEDAVITPEVESIKISELVRGDAGETGLVDWK